MRRKIDLYIDGRKADLTEDLLVLFNYSQDDLANPAIVKNSYSAGVSLPGTVTNNTIFGDIYRLDRVAVPQGSVYSGEHFDPMKRTPFQIIDDKGNIIEAGYLKLDNISRSGVEITYNVTLYGALGAFFYGLSYGSDGEKLTLADLDYLGTSSPDSELDFAINATTVQTAWTRLFANATNSTIEQIWDVLNFAPAYEGIPDGDFDASKAYGIRADLGLSIQGVSVHQDLTSEGGTLISLPEPIDGWASREFRSYLLRPVLSVRAFLLALKRRAAALGYTFDFSLVYDQQLRSLWKTLPSIPSLGTFRKSTGNLTGTLASTATSSEEVGTWTLSGLDSMVGVQVAARLAFNLRWNTSTYNYDAKFQNGNATKASLFFVQALAYDTYDNLVGGSDVLLVGPDTTTLDGNAASLWLGYEPTWPTDRYSYWGTQPVATQTGQYGLPNSIVLNVDAESVTKYVLRVTAYNAVGNFSQAVGSVTGFDGGGDSSVPPTVWDEDGDPQAWDTCLIQGVSGSTSFSYARPNQPRSGAALGKATLLSGKYSPAEYLISLAKQYGWCFLTDTGAKSITIMPRNYFYNTGLDQIDLSERIDTGQPVTIEPLFQKAKWYTFGQEVTPSAFAEEYKRIYGMPYGWLRVNTGYDFDAADIDLLAGSALRGAACIRAHGPGFRRVTQSSTWRPTQFLGTGLQYALKKTADGSLDTYDVPTLPNTVTITYDNPTNNGYDKESASRLELRNAEGKPVDGEDLLVKFDGSDFYSLFAITDDSAGMLQVNDGIPCWNWSIRSGTLRVPVFTRYYHPGLQDTNAGLDFSIPAQVDIPDVVFNLSSTLYERSWKAFMRDRYDRDTKVLRCRVNLEGLDVGQSLLRRFFWYDGSVWVLNKITNYSLTTWDTAECEFIQVQDTTNYTSGQIW